MKQKIFFIEIIFLLLLFNSYAQKINYGNNPVAGKYITINGAKLYYEVYGKGAPMLLLHGNSGSISQFNNQIPFFSKKYKVIAVDSRLQGRSGGNEDTLSYDMMAADFCALLDALHLDSAYVLGWSDGGVNGLIMAMHCPGKVRALAVSGANVQPDSTAFSIEDVKSTEDFVLHNKTASKKEMTLNRLMLYQPNISFEQLGKIKCPVLLMAGDHDLIKPEHTLKIFRSIPTSELCIFPDSNHGICQQHPLMFNNVVLDFFRKYKTR